MPRQVLSLAILALSLTTISACGDPSNYDSGNTGTTTNSTGDTGTIGDGTDGGSSTDGGSLTGQVLMSDGTAANVQMRLCAELCRSIMTDDAGNFEYLAVEESHYAFEAIYLADQKNYASPLDLMSFAEDQDRTLDTPVIIYPFETVHDLGDKIESVDLDGGLTVMADPSVMLASESNSPYLSTDEPDYVSAVRVDPSAVGLPMDEVEGTVVAAWFMGRFSVSLTTPWAFTLDDDLGLAEGSQVRVLASSYDNKGWMDGGTGTVVSGQIISDDGAGIPVLSTVVFVAE